MVTNIKRKRPYCNAPFCNLMVEGSGQVRVCCASKESVGDLSRGESLASIRSTDKLKKLQSEMFVEDSIPDHCQRCADKEASGLESHRIKFNRRSSSYLEQLEDVADATGLFEMDLSFSNTCNLDCVMCSSQYSNKWIEIEEKFGISENPFRGFKHHKIKEEVVDELLLLSAGVRRVTIKGGEPLVDSNCLRFLQGLAERKFQGEIVIVTNLTVLNEAILRVLERLVAVRLVVSIDGVDSVYEWIRGVPFARVADNILKVAEVDSVLAITPRITLSAYNLWNLTEYLPWVHNLHLEHRKVEQDNLSQTVMNRYLNSRSLPLSWREELLGSLRELSIGSEYLSSTLLNYMQLKEASREEMMHFLDWSEKFNQYRKVDIFEVAPHVRRLRDYI